MCAVLMHVWLCIGTCCNGYVHWCDFFTDYGLPEYKVFTDYYSKLVDTIPACSLSHYFVSENVISLTDHEEITKPTTPSHRAAQLLLNKVLYMLKEHKSVDCFNRMISIMEHHGDGATHALSQEIQSRLLKINSGQQGIIHCTNQHY